MMKHQNPLAQSVGPNIKGGAKVGERVGPSIPRPAGLLGRRRISWIVFAVIKSNFEEPVSPLRKILVPLIRRLWSVMNAFDVKVCERRQAVLAVTLVRGCRV